MHREPDEILKLFNIDNARHPEMVFLRDITLKQCTTPQKAALLLIHLEEDDKNFGHHPEYRALCALCKACAYNKIGETKFRDILKKEVNTAIDLLRSSGNTFNEGVSHWFLGVVNQIHNDESEAIIEFEKAIEAFNTCAKSHETSNQYLQQIYCKEHCGLVRYFLSTAYRIEGSKSHARNEIKESIKLLESCIHSYKEMESKYKSLQNKEHSTLAHKMEIDCQKRLKAIKIALKPPKKDKKIPGPLVGNTNYLALSWLPIYQSVQAGANGPVWTSPPKGDLAAFPLVILDGELHMITLLKGSGNQLTLTSDRRYGWASVRGQSMNKATPVKLENGDYILFENVIGPNTRQPVNKDIVIVSQLGNGGFTYMVKRFRDAEKIVVSETTESGEQYQALPLNENRQILGIVIAIAKRQKQQSPSVSKSTPPIDKKAPQKKQPMKNNARYDVLVQMVNGNENVAKGLVTHEMGHAPDISTQEAIERAIVHLERDRS
jgi:hypothetical protein